MRLRMRLRMRPGVAFAPSSVPSSRLLPECTAAGKRGTLVVLASKRSRAFVARHAAALIAVAGLLGQALFPHVHVVSSVSVRVSTPRQLAAAASWVVGCPAVRANATVPTADGDDHHAPSSCPLCRAQSDARSSLLPAAFALPAPVGGVATPARDLVASLAAVARSVAAPRAPPFAS